MIMSSKRVFVDTAKVDTSVCLFPIPYNRCIPNLPTQFAGMSHNIFYKSTTNTVLNNDSDNKMMIKLGAT